MFRSKRVLSGDTYTKIGTIQRRLAWPLRKDDTQIREAFQIFKKALSILPFSVTIALRSTLVTLHRGMQTLVHLVSIFRVLTI